MLQNIVLTSHRIHKYTWRPEFADFRKTDHHTGDNNQEQTLLPESILWRKSLVSEEFFLVLSVGLELPASTSIALIQAVYNRSLILLYKLSYAAKLDQILRMTRRSRSLTSGSIPNLRDIAVDSSIVMLAFINSEAHTVNSTQSNR